jgi:hypothetical protein
MTWVVLIETTWAHGNRVMGWTEGSKYPPMSGQSGGTSFLI